MRDSELAGRVSAPATRAANGGGEDDSHALRQAVLGEGMAARGGARKRVILGAGHGSTSRTR